MSVKEVQNFIITIRRIVIALTFIVSVNLMLSLSGSSSYAANILYGLFGIAYLTLFIVLVVFAVFKAKKFIK